MPKASSGCRGGRSVRGRPRDRAGPEGARSEALGGGRVRQRCRSLRPRGRARGSAAHRSSSSPSRGGRLRLSRTVDLDLPAATSSDGPGGWFLAGAEDHEAVSCPVHAPLITVPPPGYDDERRRSIAWIAGRGGSSEARSRWRSSAGCAGVAIATGAGDTDQPLTGSTLDRARAAALEFTGGGTVTETEAGDDGAAYGVEVRLDDGRVVEVRLGAELPGPRPRGR